MPRKKVVEKPTPAPRTPIPRLTKPVRSEKAKITMQNEKRTRDLAELGRRLSGVEFHPTDTTNIVTVSDTTIEFKSAPDTGIAAPTSPTSRVTTPKKPQTPKQKSSTIFNSPSPSPSPKTVVSKKGPTTMTIPSPSFRPSPSPKPSASPKSFVSRRSTPTTPFPSFDPSFRPSHSPSSSARSSVVKKGLTTITNLRRSNNPKESPATLTSPTTSTSHSGIMVRRPQIGTVVGGPIIPSLRAMEQEVARMKRWAKTMTGPGNNVDQYKTSMTDVMAIFTTIRDSQGEIKKTQMMISAGQEKVETISGNIQRQLQTASAKLCGVSDIVLHIT